MQPEAPLIGLYVGSGEGGGSEVLEAGDFLARTALKALLEITTSPDSRVERATELELSDALMAWVDTRREREQAPEAV